MNGGMVQVTLKARRKKISLPFPG